MRNFFLERFRKKTSKKGNMIMCILGETLLIIDTKPSLKKHLMLEFFFQIYDYTIGCFKESESYHCLA